MIDKTIRSVISIVACLVVAACVTSVDESLPYAQLPEITVATPFNLVASPSHPTAYLSSDKILAGEKVRVIGTDKNAAWLLVLHDNLLGWMPTFFSATNIATLKPAILVEPLADKCSKYFGSTFAPNEAWVSNTNGSVIVLGSIYRPQAGKRFESAALAVEIGGDGVATAADYVHLSLTGSSAVIFFAFSVDELQSGSQIRFRLTNPSNEPLFFETAFFSNDCPDDLDTARSEHVDWLPIGQPKATVTKRVATPEGAAPTPTQRASIVTPTPVVIARESGSTTSPRQRWTFCADENQFCAFSGTKEVRYGANGQYVVKKITNGTNCSNSVFGDPTPGVVKRCYYRDMQPPVPASIVINGDFEMPNAGSNFVLYKAKQGIEGWTVASGSIDHVGLLWKAISGQQSVDLSGTTDEAGSIYQDLTTVAGETYQLSFWYGGNPWATPDIKQMQVWWGDTLVDTLISDTAGRTDNDILWVKAQYSVVAQSTVTRLKFTSLIEGNSGPTLDNVSVSQSANAAQQVGSDCIQPLEGLISWWPGDGNADDVVGGNDGKPVGGVEFMDGMVGQAFRFDGSNDIVMATATGFPTGAAPRTVAFWAKTDPSANNATGFGYGNETGGGGFYIFPAHGENGRRLTFSGHGTSVNVFASNNLRDGQYHYVAATYDGGKLTLYVNGIPVASGNPGLNTGTSGGACIGGRCYQGEFFTGEVDEVAVWDRNLSTAEIEALFNAGSAGMCKPGTGIKPAPTSTSYDTVSIQSYNYPDRYVRHQNSLGELTQVTADLDRRDATFVIVPGLADNNCISFESLNYPRNYLRHQDFRIKLHAFEDAQLFKADATFCKRPGLADSALVSFESYNYPGYFLRHRDFHLYIEPGNDALFRADVTFSLIAPFVASSSGGR